MLLDVTDIILARIEDPEYNDFAIQAMAIKDDCTNKARIECEAVIKKYAGIAARKIVKLYKEQKK